MTPLLTLKTQASHPEIVIDRYDNAYVIYCSDLSRSRMVATLSPSPDYIYHPGNTQILWEEDLGYAEPIIDRSRWQRDNVLSMLLQRNEQPNIDIGHEVINHPITLLDISSN